MHERLNGRAALAALVLVASGLFAAAAGAPAAQAAAGTSDNCQSASSGGTSGGGGSVSGSTITMWEQLTVSSQAALCPAGNTSGSGSNWVPPQCWWAPEYSPDELGAAIGQLDTNGGSAIDTYMALNAEYASLGPDAPLPANYVSTQPPPWDLYNIGASPAGEWWGLVWNEDITLQGITDCTNIDTAHFPKDWYWVTPGADGPAPGDAPTLNAEELALYIAGKVKLTPLQIQTDPSVDTTKATVGLPTWAWADGADTKVTDEICTQPQYGDICVNLTAQAEGFSMSSSDPGATIYSDCKLDPASGIVGTEYTDGGGTPPCGVTFSQPGNWTLTMDTTWNVQIDWAGGGLNPKPDPVTETILNANVQEVQAINN